MAIKRLHYFDHQFLVEADFSDEQKYHLDMRRRLNRMLYTFGIADGLEVVKSASKTVTVRPGVAIDRLGREMIVEADQIVDLSNAVAFPAGATVFITIAYQEQESDPTTATGVSGNTRITEQPGVQAVTVAPPSDGTVVQLARLTLDSSANVPGNVNDAFDGGARQRIGPRGERGPATLDNVSNPGGNIDLVPANTVTIVPDDANNRITIGETHSALTNNPHNTTAAQVGAVVSVDGVSNAGGNIDLVQANTVTIVPDDANNRITIGETHSALTNNPHNTTAAQVGAVVSVDGVSNAGGNIDLLQANSVTIVPDDANNRITIGETHSALTTNPHNTTAAQVGALPVAGGTVTGTLSISDGTAMIGLGGDATTGFGTATGKRQALFISGATNTSVGGGPTTAVLIWPLAQNVSGLNIFAATGAVDTLNVAGTARFTGTKIGYVADSFVNGSGTMLRTGDVVKLKAGGSIRFHGDNNRIPIPEVTLADSENDPLVIGIVAQEATPAVDEPDRRTEPDDPTTIPDTGELFVVTLGTYAHCKVDATVAPIEVGDLLTSSANPGHAKKATDPKIGAIIGKALEPLREGTGYIAVFVNIQ